MVELAQKNDARPVGNLRVRNQRERKLAEDT